ncbi:AraC family transcriptional regulator [Plantactinospora soyae]|uniref:AraC-like DNA-binding protein n=1 Tax=Plantactinospora soyae TaxID=1544732 RepID=A0A927MH77_9ACTN|nr:helix-turn-helix domain-containing protein [Plantactinospora soyae]MBE1491095.1 AraC-like DNA-binding protein [Plantactinospora soyae]
MAHLTQIHSVPTRSQPGACETVTALPPPRLRPYVLGYSGFRSATGAQVRHRILPLNVTTLIVDFSAPGGLVTGPRSTSTVSGRTCWGHGVAVGLTPAGVSALLGVPMPALTEGTVPLAEFLGQHDAELTERLGDAPDWSSRFAVLDDRLAAWSATERQPDGPVLEAWWRLQRPGGRLRIGTLAKELGVSRRYLELGFRRQIGLSPGTVARIARFQHAVYLLGRGAGLPRTAVDSGYADQPHLNRQMRAMAGVTPAELCAILQYLRPVPG